MTQEKKDPQASPEHLTDSGIVIQPVYRPEDLGGWDPARQLGEPGSFPYTRGVHAQMYRSKLWTMRQYAGFGSAEQTNQRFKFFHRSAESIAQPRLEGPEIGPTNCRDGAYRAAAISGGDGLVSSPSRLMLVEKSR